MTIGVIETKLCKEVFWWNGQIKLSSQVDLICKLNKLPIKFMRYLWCKEQHFIIRKNIMIDPYFLKHTFYTVKLVTYSVITSATLTQLLRPTHCLWLVSYGGCSMLLSSAVDVLVCGFRGKNCRISWVCSLARSCWAFQCAWMWCLLLVTHCPARRVGLVKMVSGSTCLIRGCKLGSDWASTKICHRAASRSRQSSCSYVPASEADDRLILILWPY